MTLNPVQMKKFAKYSGLRVQANGPWVTSLVTMRDRRRVSAPAAATPQNRRDSPKATKSAPKAVDDCASTPCEMNGTTMNGTGRNPRRRNSQPPTRASGACSAGHAGDAAVGEMEVIRVKARPVGEKMFGGAAGRPLGSRGVSRSLDSALTLRSHTRGRDCPRKALR